MNILFLTLLDFKSIQDHNIYADLMREFVRRGHNAYIISPVERRYNQESSLILEENVQILKLKIGNTQKTNLIEKGISTLMIEPLFIQGIKKYFSNVKFDLILYSTPPITFCNAIKYVKQRDGAKTYLLLKDIFPQNAVDIGIIRKNGAKCALYLYFRKMERRLYAISDRIGCMSQANVNYLIKHNPQIDPNIVEICPNCIEVIDKSVDAATRQRIRENYGIPLGKKVFVYGGNLGKPQGIDFIIDCMRSQKDNDEVYFLIVGDGTEYGKLEAYVKTSNQGNLKLLKRLSRADYDTMIGACDVGMIFLDHRFTIPNFPSRLLSYMQAKLPVLAVTDPNTDVGKMITEHGFGWWCESNNIAAFDSAIAAACRADMDSMQENAWNMLLDCYTTARGYDIIVNNNQRG